MKRQTFHNVKQNVKQTSPGFTLLEMLVTVAITMLMVIVINQVFSSVNQATGVSKGISQVMANSRIVQDQFTRDFDQMIGPHEGGFMVIGIEQQKNKPITKDDEELGNEFNIQTDQILFIRRRGSLEPICPGGKNSFSNSSQAAYCRMWYGHLELVDDTNGNGNDNIVDFMNKPASQWVLGRQALHLDSTTPGGAYVKGAFAGSSGSAHFSGQLFQGYNDIAFMGLKTATSNGALIGGTEPAENKDGKRLYTNIDAKKYSDRARDYIYGKFRLQAVTHPGVDFESKNVARMHPYFSPRTSQVKIEFAGDYTTNRKHKLTTNIYNTNDQPDGELDTYEDGTIIWYGQNKLPPKNQFADGNAAGGLNPLPIAAPIYKSGSGTAINYFIFRHGPGKTNWPHLLRIRYRIHDKNNHMAGSDGDVGYEFEQIIKVNRK